MNSGAALRLICSSGSAGVALACGVPVAADSGVAVPVLVASGVPVASGFV